MGKGIRENFLRGKKCRNLSIDQYMFLSHLLGEGVCYLDFLARNHALESWRSSCCNIARQLMFSKHMQGHKGFGVPY